jgi:hypothetical protein
MMVLSTLCLGLVVPAQAWAGQWAGIVLANHAQRGTMVLAGAHRTGVTVHGGLAASVGDRITVTGSKLHDGTIRLSKLRVVDHLKQTTVRGTIVKTSAGGTLISTGSSVILIHSNGRRLAAVFDGGHTAVGTIADFRVRFDDDDLVQAAPPVPVGQAATVRIEGAIVSISPFVISVEGLPVTITVPTGMTLPAGLAPGQRIELSVQVAPGNTFTLAAIGDVENNDANVAQQQEVEVKGVVSSSSAAQLAIDDGGATFTFVAPSGVTLPVLAAGTPVEVKGIDVNGILTVTRLRVEDNEDGDGGNGGNAIPGAARGDDHGGSRDSGHRGSDGGHDGGSGHGGGDGGH